MTEDLKGPNLEEPGTEQVPETITPAVDSPTPSSASSEDSRSLVATPLRLAGPRRYTFRFALAYTGLGIVLVAALTGLAVLVIKPGYHTPAPWSTWKPPSGTTAKMASAIADHVAHEYKLNAKGTQLVAVVAGPPKVTSGTKDVKISTLAVRKAPQSNTGMQILSSNKTWTDQLCGLGAACSIDSGQATATRGRLVRREALEVALYTFKFVPAIDSVVAFMPPPPGQTTTTLLFLEKSNLKDQLSTPLKKTLTAPKPPLPTAADTAEVATIDKLTLPAVFSYSLTQLQDGSAALILDPIST